MQAESNSSRRKVAVMIDPGDSWGRRVILGISSAVRHILPWDLLIAPQDSQWRQRIPPTWRGEGIIAAARDKMTAAHVRSLNLPTVHTSLCELTQETRFRVITNDQRRAELAFQHFLDRGYQNYAYFGPRNQRYPESRGEAFHQVVTKAGYFCDVYTDSGAKLDPHAFHKKVKAWLSQLPQPVAIFAADPHPALQLLEVCRSAGIHVPENVAVLSGDTDDVLCGIADPPLSSILLGCEEIGERSVAMLKTLLDGQEPESPIELISPMRVIERQSTDILAINDLYFTQALRYIRQNAHRGIQVGDILHAVPVSRRFLEQKFLKYLDRSPADEIRKIRLERVKHLLTMTDQSIEQIALTSGFSSSSQLGVVFRKSLGKSPVEFRKTTRRE